MSIWRRATMKNRALFPLLFHLSFLLAAAISGAREFDFFYFVQQWPGSYCDTKQSCCYPNTGKPDADFGIHGLWPNYKDGTYPSNCDPRNPYNESKIEDLIGSMQAEWPTLSCPTNNGTKFWKHEWDKHGTCSESHLDQHAYFQTALNLKKQVNLLHILQDTGIEPDGGYYKVNRITEAIKEATGFTPAIECNRDEAGNNQLIEVYLCVDVSGTRFIECPVLPRRKCASRIEFPAF